MSVRARVIAAGLVVLSLVACDTDPSTEQPDPTDGAEAPGAPEVGPSPDGSSENGTGERDDGVLRVADIVLPVPDGWVVDQELSEQGLVGATPDAAETDQLLLGAAGVAQSDLFGVQGAGFDAAVDHFRALIPAGPDVDEDVQIGGARRARLLRFDDMQVEPDAELSHEVIIIAEDEAGRLALFNYAGTVDGFDEGVVDLLVREARFASGD